jgi:hypothetical protein
MCEAFPVRAVLPWATVGLLVLGTATGAGLGLAGQSPGQLTAAQEISRIIATTRGARTARFSYSSVNVSSNPHLRSSTSGEGLVNFRSDSMSTTERDRSSELSETTTATSAHRIDQGTVFDEIWIGATEYTRLRIAIADDSYSPWIKDPAGPKDSPGAFGAFEEIGPLGSLTLDESVHGMQVDDTGHERVRGVETTVYRLVLPACMAASRGNGFSESLGPTELWVDGKGRLVQARSSTRLVISNKRHGTAPPIGGVVAGRVASVDIIHIDDFGAPATITAPHVETSVGVGESGFALSRRTGCPS